MTVLIHLYTPHTIQHPIDTLQTPLRHPPDAIETPLRHPPDSHQPLSRQFPNTFQAPTRQSSNFKHVGAFLLLEARCGFFFPPSFFLRWENKVNCYSNQLKLSWVCKLEWSLTIKTFGMRAITRVDTGGLTGKSRVSSRNSINRLSCPC